VPSPWDMLETAILPDEGADAHSPFPAGSPSPDLPDTGLDGNDLQISPTDLISDSRDFAEVTSPPRAGSTYAMSARGDREQDASRRDSCPSARRRSVGNASCRAPTSPRGAPSSALGVDASLGVAATGSEKVYDPEVHFNTACGDDDENIRHLVDEVNLFFLCELASLHCAIHEDGLAAQLLWGARVYSDSLPSNHPDTAIVWCGIGRIAFHSGSYRLAARCLARARRIREKTIGEDTVETAATYNNLACCLAALDRPLEASVLLELAAELMKVLLGHDHPRTQTATRNLEKSRTSAKHLSCEVPHLFSIPVQDRCILTKAKKKKRGAKKKGEAAGDEDSAKPKRRGQD